jgi:hypothetical protein
MAAAAPSLFCAERYCKTCKKKTKFIPIPFAVDAGVRRRTLYDWMDRGLIHWHALPSGRRIICQESLITNCCPGFPPKSVPN